VVDRKIHAVEDAFSTSHGLRKEKSGLYNAHYPWANGQPMERNIHIIL